MKQQNTRLNREQNNLIQLLSRIFDSHHANTSFRNLIFELLEAHLPDEGRYVR
jgi:hypothetical protein